MKQTWGHIKTERNGEDRDGKKTWEKRKTRNGIYGKKTRTFP